MYAADDGREIVRHYGEGPTISTYIVAIKNNKSGSEKKYFLEFIGGK